jgi:hypothetical protein
MKSSLKNNDTIRQESFIGCLVGKIFFFSMGIYITWSDERCMREGNKLNGRGFHSEGLRQCEDSFGSSGVTISVTG